MLPFLIVNFLVKLSIQVCPLVSLLLIEVGDMSLIVLLEFVLNQGVLGESFVILWICLEFDQTLLRQSDECSALDLGDC